MVNLMGNWGLYIKTRIGSGKLLHYRFSNSKSLLFSPSRFTLPDCDAKDISVFVVEIVDLVDLVRTGTTDTI